jgi:hypothetical protein
LLLDCAPATVEAKAVQRRVRMFVRITGIPLESLNYLNRFRRGRTRFI